MMIFYVVGYFAFACSTALNVQSSYKSVPGIPEELKTKMARTSNGLGNCGSRVNVANMTLEALVSKEWCEQSITEPGYIYMLKTEVKVMKDDWIDYTNVPVCVKRGSKLEISLTPTWTTSRRINIRLFNDSFTEVLDFTVLQGSGILEINKPAVLTIAVLADSYMTYINGEEYVNYAMNPHFNGMTNYPVNLQINPAPAVIHHVIFVTPV